MVQFNLFLFRGFKLNRKNGANVLNFLQEIYKDKDNNIRQYRRSISQLIPGAFPTILPESSIVLND